MRRKSLYIQASIALGILLLANVGIKQLASNSVPRKLLQHSKQVEPATDLFLGNSTMAAGIDERAFNMARPGRKALNQGLGSTYPVEHYLIYLQQQKHHQASVYYGFFDSQLTDPSDGNWANLVGNRAISYYTDLNAALEFYSPNDLAKSTLLRVVSWIPMLVERNAVWSKVELLRRDLESVGLPAKKTNRFGRVEDFAQLEPENDKIFARLCSQTVSNKVPLTSPVVALLQKAKNQKVPMYVIDMPMPKLHRQKFYSSSEWKLYRSYIESLIKKQGGVFVTSSDWINDDGFSDHLHLNTVGAKKFSILLGQWVAKYESKY